jgi:lipopolysaccharide export system protein LptA
VRLTIERIRTLVLIAGGLLIIALVAFLAAARWRSHLILREIPKRLGANIERQADGFVYTQAHGGRTLFKIRASKVIQLKKGGRSLLQDVQIELYGEDGSRVDRISGNEFEWDDKAKIATAAGPVEIILTRPGEALALAPNAAPGRMSDNSDVLSGMAHTASQGEIHVKTSGLTFDQKDGVATTAQRVEFAITQGNGSSMGASFDSGKAQLVLDREVELDVRRGPETVQLRADHAEFERDNLLCRMHGVRGNFRGGEAAAGDASVLFRQDGSAARLDAANGFSVTSATMARIAAPKGTLEFNEHNQPHHGRLEGGATIDSSSNGRQLHGTAPTADLEFTADGALRHAHLERGVTMHSDETSAGHEGDGESVKVSRDWLSPYADLDFRQPRPTAKGQVELASLRGMGGVVITGRAQRGDGQPVASRMAADQVTATFGDTQALTKAVGTGHAVLEQTTASGAKQTTSGDRLEASFGASSEAPAQSGIGSHNGQSAAGGAQIQSAVVEGNVVLAQEPAEGHGEQQDAGMRATAGKAVYEAAGEWVHLTDHPRVEDGGLQLTANKVDFSQESGDAFAHGNVKATWMGAPAKQAAPSGVGNAPGSLVLGGQGAAHVIASDAQLHRATGEATFRGQARLWQLANSISAPVIVLDRVRQTLVARSTSASDPVKVVMLSAGGAAMGERGTSPDPTLAAKDAARMGHPAGGEGGASADPTLAAKDAARMGHPGSPGVIRVRGGELKYSEAERKAVMRGDAAGSVVADTGSATSTSNQLELLLLPPGNHAAKDGGAAQVDRLTASGHVVVSAGGRRGTGERLVYSSQTDEYVLTGTAADPPKMTDAARGTVSGESLIFNSRDDSVSIEGGGRKTLTETIAPK